MYMSGKKLSEIPKKHYNLSLELKFVFWGFTSVFSPFTPPVKMCLAPCLSIENILQCIHENEIITILCQELFNFGKTTPIFGVSASHTKNQGFVSI